MLGHGLLIGFFYDARSIGINSLCGSGGGFSIEIDALRMVGAFGSFFGSAWSRALGAACVGVEGVKRALFCRLCQLCRIAYG